MEMFAFVSFWRRRIINALELHALGGWAAAAGLATQRYPIARTIRLLMFYFVDGGGVGVTGVAD